MPDNVKYKVREFVVKQPRVIRINGRWVGVGGSVWATPEPPHLPYLIPEATPAEYLQISRNNSYLVENLE